MYYQILKYCITDNSWYTKKELQRFKTAAIYGIDATVDQLSIKNFLKVLICFCLFIYSLFRVALIFRGK